MQNIPENAVLYMPIKFQPILGAVQIVHGMGEHQGRYKAFAQYLASCGYAVGTSDIRGHGSNIKLASELGYMGDNAAARVIGDVHELTKYIRDKCPSVPYFLIGHGMGAIICCGYIKKYDNFIDGLFLSGMPSDSGLSYNKVRCQSQINMKGEYERSKSFYKKIYASYSKGRSAWLTLDERVRAEFDEDPKCGFVYTLNGYSTYFDLLENAYKSGSWIRKNLHLPITIISGAKDPVSGSKRKLNRICSLFRQQGYDNIETHLFHGLRHDIYNDTEKDKTYDFILNKFEEITKNLTEH